VPLDRTGAVAGTIRLSIRRIRPANRSARGVIVALAGGPGQAANSFATDFAAGLHPFTGRRDVIVFDQRGTGSSGLLRCAGLERAFRGNDTQLATREAGRCAQTVGPRRSFYTSRDSGDDIEAIRRALGVERISLYGVSYGTKVAEGYALRHRAHVASLILDSVVAPDGPDAFDRPTFAAIPRVLASLCRGVPGCNASGYLGRLAPRLRRRPLRGAVIDAGGRVKATTMRPEDLVSVLIEGDLNPLLRADLSGGMRAALDGDAAPLLRLLAVARYSPDGPAALSGALYTATTCEELALPWPRTTPAADRPALAAAALAAIPAATFSPFDPLTALRADSIELCEGWPAAPAAPSFGTAALPNVPALLLAGRDDLRTPVSDARRVRRRLPRAQLLEVPGVGHSVVGSDQSGCVARALARFAAGHRVARCASRRFDLPQRTVFPRSLAAVPPYTGTSGRAGRTLYAALLTLFDTDDYAYYGAPRGGGLRGGTYRRTPRRLTLSDMVYVPGIAVSGTYVTPGVARLRVSGSAAAAGTITVAPNGLIDATLGGRHLVLRTGSASAAGRSGSLTHRPLIGAAPRRPR